MHVNLLPTRFLLRVAILRRVRNWAPIWTGLGLLSLITVGYAFHCLRQERAELAALTERCDPLKRIQAETASYEKKRTGLQGEIRTLQAIQSHDRTLNLLGLLGQAARSAERVQIQRMAFTAPKPPVATARGKAAATTPESSRVELATLSLSGIAGGDTALARFIDSLRSLEIFEHVELKSLSLMRAASGDGRQFQVECRFAE